MEQRFPPTSGTLGMFYLWQTRQRMPLQRACVQQQKKPTWVQRSRIRIYGRCAGVAVVLPNFPKEGIGLLQVPPQLSGVFVVAVKHPGQFPGCFLLLCVPLHGARQIWSPAVLNWCHWANCVAATLIIHDTWMYVPVPFTAGLTWGCRRRARNPPHSVLFRGRVVSKNSQAFGFRCRIPKLGSVASISDVRWLEAQVEQLSQVR